MHLSSIDCSFWFGFAPRTINIFEVDYCFCFVSHSNNFSEVWISKRFSSIQTQVKKNFICQKERRWSWPIFLFTLYFDEKKKSSNRSVYFHFIIIFDLEYLFKCKMLDQHPTSRRKNGIWQNESIKLRKWREKEPDRVIVHWRKITIQGFNRYFSQSRTNSHS